MPYSPPMRLFALVLALAVTGCHRDSVVSDAGVGDAGVEDAGVDVGQRDAGPDAGPDLGPPPPLPPCEDPSLWSATPAWSEEHFMRRGCAYVQLEFPLASRSARSGRATEVCWRITEAGPGTGHEAGDTWRSVEAAEEPFPHSTRLTVRTTEGPLVIRARFFDPTTHALWEVVNRVRQAEPVPAARGVVDFIDFAQGESALHRWPGEMAYASASEFVDRGERVPLPGRVLGAGSWRLRSAVLVEERDERWLLLAHSEAGEALERVPLDVSASTRFVSSERPALFDADRAEVVFLDRETHLVDERWRLPEGTSDVVVVPRSDITEVYARVGSVVHRGATSDAFAPLVGLPPATRLLERRGDPLGSARPVVVGDAGLTYVGWGGEFGEPQPVDDGLPGSIVGLSGDMLVAEGGFAFAFARGARGGSTYDTRERYGGPISHLSLDGAAWAVARPDGTHDLYRTPDRCPGE